MQIFRFRRRRNGGCLNRQEKLQKFGGDEVVGGVATPPCRTSVVTNPPSPTRKKTLSKDKVFFQLNPPLRVGEILLRNVKYARGG